jgi:hypothetical protein
MQIFFLDYDQQLCAQYHCDKHVVNQIKESVQLLSTACRLSGIDVGYKLNHINHPISIWVRSSIQNYNWLTGLVEALHTEYQYRYGDKVHKSYLVYKTLLVPNLPDIGLTKFPTVISEDCIVDDPIESYRIFYIKYKLHFAKWKNRSIPEWIDNLVLI